MVEFHFEDNCNSIGVGLAYRPPCSLPGVHDSQHDGGWEQGHGTRSTPCKALSVKWCSGISGFILRGMSVWIWGILRIYITCLCQRIGYFPDLYYVEVVNSQIRTPIMNPPPSTYPPFQYIHMNRLWT